MWRALGEKNLAAKAITLFKQRHLAAASRRGLRRLAATGAATNHNNVMMVNVDWQLTIAQLMRALRIDGALKGHAFLGVLFQGLEAAQTTDALAKFGNSTLLNLIAPLGIGEPRAAKTGEVDSSFLEECLGNVGATICGDRNHGNADVLFHRSDDVMAPSLGITYWLHARNAGLVEANGHVYEVDACLFERHADLDAVCSVDVVLGNPGLVEEFLDGDAAAKRKACGTALANACDDLGDDAQAVLKAATILVCSLVGVGREELLQQVAMRAVKLDTIEARALGTNCAFDKLLDYMLDLFRRECAGLRLRLLARNRRRRDNRLSAEKDIGCLPAWVMQLQECLGTMAVNCLSKARELRNITVACDGNLAQLTDARLVVNPADLWYH